MKKILYLLMTIFCISIFTTNIYAETFYEAEYIDNVYMRMYKGSTMKYQKARFFRRSSDNRHAYCLQPFLLFDYTKTYYDHNILSNTDKWKKIILIAHFGYGYRNHTDPKWYAITQNMIWQTLEPENTFYFTDTLNGNYTNKFDGEVNEINNLINRYNKKPDFGKVISYTVAGSDIILTDKNNVLSDYTIKKGDHNARIEGNKLYINNVKEGITNILLQKRLENEDHSSIYFYNDQSQDLFINGDLGIAQTSFSVTATTNSVTIHKIDADTKSNVARGDASLKDTIIGLYNENDELLQEIKLNDDASYKLENLAYGKYYLKELSAGDGYHINEEKYYFTINMNTKDISIDIENKVIEKEITIHKEYGSKNSTVNESNISFDIIDSNNNLVDTVTTDIKGDIKITLPYGKYLVRQRNTSKGYNKVDDFEIVVDDNNDNYYYNLYDYKIEVPNTGIKESNSYILLFLLIIPMLFIKKKYVN